MMRPYAKASKAYLYPKTVDLRKSIDGLTALVELDIKVAVFDLVLFVFLNRAVNEATIKSFHYPDFDALKAHARALATAYNFAERLKALR